MKRILAVGVAALTLSAGADGQQAAASRVAGSWVGTYTTSNGTGQLTIRAGNANGAWSAAVRATSEFRPSAEVVPASDVTVRGDTLWFTLRWSSPVNWHGVVKGDSIVGTLAAEYWSGTFKAKRERK